ncbi:MAG: DALR domain-containing protein, partial [Ferruginibacter sp.]
SGNSSLLTQAYSPMTIRFFILQSHYRSTLDFSNEALIASEKAFKRLWDAYEILLNFKPEINDEAADQELDKKINNWVNDFEVFMDDDLATPKVIANMFEIVPTINSIKDKLIPLNSLSEKTILLMQNKFKIFLEDILGLKNTFEIDNDVFNEVMKLIIEIRTIAKAEKDFVTSDKIRNHLTKIGVVVKDEKDGSVSWSI